VLKKNENGDKQNAFNDFFCERSKTFVAVTYTDFRSGEKEASETCEWTTITACETRRFYPFGTGGGNAVLEDTSSATSRIQ